MHGYDQGYGDWGPGVGPWGAGHDWLFGALALAAPFLLFIVLWSIVWKGLALWHSARRAQPVWFCILLVVNTLGILEIIYLLFVAKLKFNQLFTKGPHHS